MRGAAISLYSLYARFFPKLRQLRCSRRYMGANFSSLIPSVIENQLHNCRAIPRSSLLVVDATHSYIIRPDTLDRDVNTRTCASTPSL
jgi:hypothetical protein